MEAEAEAGQFSGKLRPLEGGEGAARRRFQCQMYAELSKQFFNLFLNFFRR